MPTTITGNKSDTIRPRPPSSHPSAKIILTAGSSRPPPPRPSLTHPGLAPTPRQPAVGTTFIPSPGEPKNYFTALSLQARHPPRPKSVSHPAGARIATPNAYSGGAKKSPCSTPRATPSCTSPVDARIHRNFSAPSAKETRHLRRPRHPSKPSHRCAAPPTSPRISRRPKSSMPHGKDGIALAWGHRRFHDALSPEGPRCAPNRVWTTAPRRPACPNIRRRALRPHRRQLRPIPAKATSFSSTSGANSPTNPAASYDLNLDRCRQPRAHRTEQLILHHGPQCATTPQSQPCQDAFAAQPPIAGWQR